MKLPSILFTLCTMACTKIIHFHGSSHQRNILYRTYTHSWAVLNFPFRHSIGVSLFCFLKGWARFSQITQGVHGWHASSRWEFCGFIWWMGQGRRYTGHECVYAPSYTLRKLTNIALLHHDLHMCAAVFRSMTEKYHYFIQCGDSSDLDDTESWARA